MPRRLEAVIRSRGENTRIGCLVLQSLDKSNLVELKTEGYWDPAAMAEVRGSSGPVGYSVAKLFCLTRSSTAFTSTASR
ncbi:hypothetical protein J6590_105224 [Homalodisca vitripennis]|nr:hypothetical protein J6590_105224 [Homalodisca vitripennis]